MAGAEAYVDRYEDSGDNDSIVSAAAAILITPRVSLFSYAPGILILLAVITCSHELTDPDLWGHLRFGQAALATHHLARVDTYSYAAFGKPWLNHEWLTEIIMAAAYNHFGVVGLKLWKLGCSAGTLAFAALALAETGAGAPIQLNLLTLIAVAIMPQMQFRPQLFTFVAFAALLAILARYIYRGSAHLWLVILLMAAWANLHGGFVVGLGTLGVLTAVVTIQDLATGRGLKRGLRLSLFTTLGALATIVSPYGLDSWSVVLHALRNPLTRNVITDWQPLIFHIQQQWHDSAMGLIYYACALLLICLMMASWITAPIFDDLPLIAVSILMIVGAFTAVRNLPLAALASAVPAARHLSMRRARNNSEHAANFALRSRTSQPLVASVALLLTLYAGLFSKRIAFDEPYPVRALSFMQQHGLRGNILASFGWGEYLIWHAPESKVFIDGRYDTVFTYRQIAQYVNFYFDQNDAASVLDAYPHDFVLIPDHASAIALMKQRRDWTEIYRDDEAVLFVRSTGGSATHVNTPAMRPIPRYFP